jgi:hypothetical protein
MTSVPVYSSWHDTLSDSDISELELAADGRAAMLIDKDETSDGSDYGSESSYDPLVLTEDEEFIDDSDGSSSAASSDTYEFDESSDSADNSDDTDDSEELEACDRSVDDDDGADPADIALLQAARVSVKGGRNSESTADELQPTTFVERRSQSSALSDDFRDRMGYHVARAVCLKRLVAFTCVDLGRGSYRPGAHVDRNQALSNTEAPSAVKH